MGVVGVETSKYALPGKYLPKRQSDSDKLLLKLLRIWYNIAFVNTLMFTD